ncbi:MAG: hypothetical protein OEQ53_19730, partial [Saprospiraceae bacterium]|nr:hypothetical protein [Saprospiraceae bacterium]
MKTLSINTLFSGFAAAFLVLACGNSQDQLPDSHESVQRDQLTSSDAFPAIIPLDKPADRP